MLWRWRGGGRARGRQGAAEVARRWRSTAWCLPAPAAAAPEQNRGLAPARTGARGSRSVLRPEEKRGAAAWRLHTPATAAPEEKRGLTLPRTGGRGSRGVLRPEGERSVRSCGADVEFNKVLETSFSGAGNSRFSETWNL
jgi:hypothetical protein